MDRLEKQHPDTAVFRQVVAGSPRSGLLAAADRAQLIVIGSLGRTGMTGMRLGSVTQAMLHHSPCPVAVVHPEPVHADETRPLGAPELLFKAPAMGSARRETRVPTGAV
jgi:hypothetical protein